MKKFTGVGVALVTPFDKQNNIDYIALGNLIETTILGGVDFLVLMGTTGETATLRDEEKFQLLHHAIALVKGRVPLVLGLGSNDTNALAETLIEMPTDGLDAILTVCPYYNKPNQSGLFAHFDAVANVSKLPLILYNVPGRTASNLEPQTALELAKKHKNIIAIKEASGDFSQVMSLVSNSPEHFHVLSGDDDLVVPQISIGVQGVISVAANAFPSDFSQMVHSALKGEFEQAKNLHYKLLPLIHMMFKEGNPAGVKYILNKKGICINKVRLPLVEISNDLEAQINQALGEL